MSPVNFAMIKSQHRAWVKKLSAYFKGDRSALSEIEAFSHEDCDLGKWLYAEGMIKYGAVPEMQEIEEVHVELHVMVRRITKMKLSSAFAEKELDKVEIINNKIIYLLTEVEKKIK